MGRRQQILAELSKILLERGERFSTAESCTGGLVAAACTDLAGSSGWFERGVVSYSNEAKQQLLGVGEALLAEHGAVSESVATAMAEGCLAMSGTQLAVAVTGIAGPGGGSEDKPVGTVWFAAASDQGICHTQCRQFDGDRTQVREQSVDEALRLALSVLSIKG